MPSTTKSQSFRPAKRRRGFFLVIEGADASGKSTVARRLAASYRRDGEKVVVVREPGGTKTSERIRRILLDSTGPIGARAELFLFLGARAQVVDEVIRPALDDGAIVIADRFSLSTIAYQVGGRGLPLRAVRSADELARGGVRPDLTVVLSVTGRQQADRQRRQGQRRDRMERESAKFFRAVRAAYSRYGRGPRHRVIDSGLGPEEVYRRVQEAVDRRLR